MQSAQTLTEGLQVRVLSGGARLNWPAIAERERVAGSIRFSRFRLVALTVFILVVSHDVSAGLQFKSAELGIRGEISTIRLKALSRSTGTFSAHTFSR